VEHTAGSKACSARCMHWQIVKTDSARCMHWQIVETDSARCMHWQIVRTESNRDGRGSVGNRHLGTERKRRRDGARAHGRDGPCRSSAAAQGESAPSSRPSSAAREGSGSLKRRGARPRRTWRVCLAHTETLSSETRRPGKRAAPKAPGARAAAKLSLRAGCCSLSARLDTLREGQYGRFRV